MAESMIDREARVSGALGCCCAVPLTWPAVALLAWKLLCTHSAGLVRLSWSIYVRCDRAKHTNVCICAPVARRSASLMLTAAVASRILCW